MLIKILGAIDISSGLILLFGAGVKLPSPLLLILGIILIAKSFLGMFKEFGGWVDLLSGAVLILSSLIAMPIFISIIFGILLLQKGVVSFF
ncbi:MAG: hypothetical protein Q7S06_03710 [Nanoarchaeota archaeon]|nr:hypothetical protein [Nanoarchaeota archaeon]